MTTKNAERLIVKFINNQANIEDINELTHWLETNEVNKILFEEFVKTNYLTDFVMSNYDTERAKAELLNKIRSSDKLVVKRKYSTYLKYAAILVVGIVGTYLYQSKDNLAISKSELITNDLAITLQMEDGSIQTINADQSKNVTDKNGKIIGKQDKNTIVYGDNKNKTLAYNTLKIPYGKRFQLKLSDGTKVYLNSGSSLRFPIQFLKDNQREVYLTGEAFFEVTKDKQHPFTVKSTKMNVEVFGTKFNVNAYPDESKAQVVLVEGKVGLYQETKTANDMVFLKPGFMGTKANGHDVISTQAVFTETYTSWINGGLVFRNTTFDEIIKKLERHYNVTFINNNKTLGKEVFNARFDNESIDQVLKYLNESFAIKYKIQNNKIIIQ